MSHFGLCESFLFASEIINRYNFVMVISNSLSFLFIMKMFVFSSENKSTD